MNKKKVIGSLLIIVLILSVGFYFYNFLSNKKETENNTIKGEVYQQPQSPDINAITARENKYYCVYIKYNSGPGTSFIPLKLNPDLKPDSDYNVSISTDDDGNIINDDKIIVIENFVISDKNKEMIKKIAATNYDDALQEIEDGVNDVKKDLQKQGTIK